MSDTDRPAWRRTFDRLAGASVTERILISVAALGLSIVVGAALVLASGALATCEEVALTLGGTSFCYDPVEVYVALFLGAIGGNPFAGGWSPLNFELGLTLKDTTLLLFTGLSVAVAFRAGMFNIGTQGQLVFGALATGVVVLFLAPAVPGGFLGTFVLVPVGMLAGALAGGLYGAIPGALKAYADANEVITTIMLNFVAAKVTFVLASTVFKDPGSQSVQTQPIPDNAVITPVVFPAGGDFSMIALVGALALAVGVYYLLWNTSAGFDLRTGGLQPDAAEYAGVDAKRTQVRSMALSGALGGVGGAVWVLMVTERFLADVPSLGFDGITVSILAGNHPLGAGLAALLFGVLKSGSLNVSLTTGVPKQLVGVLRGLVILFVAMPEFFRLLGRRLTLGGGSGRAPAATDGGRPVDDVDGDVDGDGGETDG